MPNSDREFPMHRATLLRLTTALVLAACWLGGSVAAAQDCEVMPNGPDRTDCYIIRARIAREKTAIAATNARIMADTARLRAITGTFDRPTTSAQRKRGKHSR